MIDGHNEITKIFPSESQNGPNKLSFKHGVLNAKIITFCIAASCLTEQFFLRRLFY